MNTTEHSIRLHGDRSSSDSTKMLNEECRCIKHLKSPEMVSIHIQNLVHHCMITSKNSFNM